MTKSCQGDEIHLPELLIEPLINGRSVPDGDGFPVLRLSAFRNGKLDFDERKNGAWSAATAAPFKISRGDIFVVRGNGSLNLVGRAAYVSAIPPAVAFPDTMIRIRVNQNLTDPRFITFQWDAPRTRSQIERAAKTTAGIYKVNQGDLMRLRFCIPPLKYQHQVVAAIETHFSRLDASVESLTRAKANVKRAMASVLKAAVEGRLVPTEAALARAERREYEPASTLLSRILTERHDRWAAIGAPGKYKEPTSPELDGVGELPTGWVWACMDQMLDSIETGKSFTAEGTPPNPDQVGIMKVSAVTWGRYDEMESKTVHEPSQINPAYFVHPGDLLFSRANTIDLVGAVVIVEYVTRRIMLSDKILRLRMPDRFKRWVQWVLRSQHGRQQIELLATGNQESMRNIGQERIRRIIIPVPPLAEQQRIVAEVDRRLSVLDALDATLNANLARCARLRQSILKRAFEGRLVPPGAPDSGAPQLPLFTEEATR